MSKVNKILAIIFLFSFGLLVYFPQTVAAANCPFTFDPPVPYQNMGDLSVTITPRDIKSGTYQLVTYKGNISKPEINTRGDIQLITGKAVTTQLKKPLSGWEAGTYTLYLRDRDVEGSVQDVAACKTSFSLSDIPAQPTCTASIETKPIDPDTKVVLKISDIASGNYDILINNEFAETYNTSTGETVFLCKGGTEDKNCKFNVGTYTVTIKNQCGFGDFTCKSRLQCKPVAFQVAPLGSAGGGQVDTTQVGTATTKQCKSKDDPTFNKNTDMVCALAGGIPCENKNDGRGPAFATAIGCIHTSPVEFIKDFLKFILGISGGLAFLMMLLGIFQMLTSAGNPETLSAGRDRLQSAVIGLLFVIFAVLLLRIIGVDILGLGGQFGL
ncbi:hypothetical protein HYS96_00785 [Candidatus Daviesbacteria bacterium]|nr:hypothetical protein [Candidatus Daviesbacteria bacterium]